MKSKISLSAVKDAALRAKAVLPLPIGLGKRLYLMLSFVKLELKLGRELG
jgi:hypothetical protein